MRRGHSFWRRWTALLLLWSVPAQAISLSDLRGLKDEADDPVNHGTEYIFKNNSDEPLIPVYLLGAVHHPGIYHVPASMNLYTLLAVSGGPTSGAELGDVVIRRSGPGPGPLLGDQVLRLDVEDLLSTKKAPAPQLVRSDVIYIPEKEPVLSGNTVLIVTFILTIVTIAVSTQTLVTR